MYILNSWSMHGSPRPLIYKLTLLSTHASGSMSRTCPSDGRYRADAEIGVHVKLTGDVYNYMPKRSLMCLSTQWSSKSRSQCLSRWRLTYISCRGRDQRIVQSEAMLDVNVDGDAEGGVVKKHVDIFALAPSQLKPSVLSTLHLWVGRRRHRF